MGSEGGAVDQAAIRTVAFAEPEAGLWGAAWLTPGNGGAGVVAVDGQVMTGPLELSGQRAQEPWQLTAPGAEFVLEGVGEPAADPNDQSQSFDQLCRVSGTLDREGGRRQVECLGWRAIQPPGPVKPGDSFRLVAGWFEPEDGFALLARRSRKAKGQEEDEITAALFEPGAARLVAEPRLSTTYADSGVPIRAGVELWLETEADSEHLYPRRAVGHAVAPGAGWNVAETTLEVQPFQWFRGGRAGPGIYLLGRR